MYGRRLPVAPGFHHNLEEWQGSLCNIISKEPPFDQNREDVLLSKTVHKTSLAHDITARDSVILYCVVAFGAKNLPVCSVEHRKV